MDERLEKIRRYEAGVIDYDTYINDRIRATKKENEQPNLSDATYLQYGLKPNAIINKECILYVISNMYNFDLRYKLAKDKMNRLRISLELADTNMFDELVRLVNEFCEKEVSKEVVAEIFG